MKAKIRKVTMIEVTYGDHKDTFRTKTAAANDLAVWMIKEKYGVNIFYAADYKKRDIPKFYGYCLCYGKDTKFIHVGDCPFHNKLDQVQQRLQRTILWYINQQ